MDQTIKEMSIRDFKELGFLRELNRQFLHPLGLALEVIVEDDGSMRFGRVWDYRDDPEGMVFGDLSGEVRAEQAKAINDLRSAKEQERMRKFGFAIQPMGHVYPSDR